MTSTDDSDRFDSGFYSWGCTLRRDSSCIIHLSDLIEHLKRFLDLT